MSDTTHTAGPRSERAQPAPEHDVFISYAEADRPWTEGYLVPALRDAGLRVLHELRLGAPRLAQFEDAVQRSRRVVLVLSPAWLSDGWGAYVDQLAAHYGVEHRSWPVVPVVLHPVELPLRLRLLVALDATAEERWQEAVTRLCADLSVEPVDSDLPARPACPYPGLLPYTEDERDAFFGREEETEQLVQGLRLSRRQLVIGPSGSGKSSLVRAGLVKALQGSSLFGKDDEHWTVRYLRPGRDPVSALRLALDADADAGTAPEASVAALSARDPGCLLLIVDQLEELFAPGTPGQAEFAAAMRRLIDVEHFHVVMTLRADFFGELLSSELWPDLADHRMELRPLRGPALRRAITRPAEEVGVFIDSALVERLVADAGDEPGALPLLQETLVLLWARLQRRLLPMSAYTSLVLTRAAYGEPESTGLQVAIARRADAALSELTPADRAVARRLLVRLVQLGEGRRDVRRQQPRDALIAAADTESVLDRVLEHLVRCRLVTTSGEQGSSVDLAHEALASNWPTFRTWLQERRAAELVRRRLVAQADEWLRHGRRAGLLDSVELQEAERWLRGPDADELGADPSVQQLVEASRAAEDARAVRDREQRERELTAARALADSERQRAEQQIATGRRLKRLVAALAALCLVAAALGSFAETQRRDAGAATRLALARQLAAQARQLPPGQIDLALLLAAQAEQVLPTEDGRSSLLTLLGSSAAPRYLHASEQALYGLAVSADGTRAYTAGLDRELSAWDTGTGRRLWSTTASSELRSLALSPDGQLLATGDQAGEVQLWTAGDGGRRGSALRGHTGFVRTARFSPDGRTLATGGNDTTIHLWDVASGRLQRPALRGHTDWVQSLDWTPDGKVLASGVGRAGGGSVETTVRLWDVTSGVTVRELTAHEHPVRALAISPDGDVLASGDESGRLLFSDARTGAALASSPSSQHERVLALRFSRDGRTVASASAGADVRLWRTSDGSPAGAAQRGHTGAVRALEAAPDGSWLSAGDDGRVAMWAGRRIPSAASLVPGSSDARGLVAEDDPRLLAWGVADGTSILDEDGGHAVRRAPPSSGRTLSMAALPGGDRIAVGGESGRLTLLSGAGPTETWSVDTVHRIVWDIAVAPDARTIATTGEDGVVRRWDTATGRPAADDLVADGRPLFTVAWSPDGRTLAAAGLSEDVHTWEVASGRRNVLGRTSSQVRSLAWARNGQMLAAGSDGDVHVWRWRGPVPVDERLASRLMGFDRFVWGLAFDPTDDRLAASGEDGTVRLWDLPSGQPSGSPMSTGDAPVFDVAFRDSGDQLVSAGSDGVVRWDVGVHRLRELACHHANRSLSDDEKALYLDGWDGDQACAG